MTAVFVPQVISAERNMSQKIDLPTLPPGHVLFPELRNEDGCTAVPPDEGGGWRCGPQIESHLDTESFLVYRALRGFKGPFYSSLVSGKSLVVLENTINISPEGKWAVYGLLRNETTETVGQAIVVSRLYDRRGEFLGEAKTLSPVLGLRPGEPAPFYLEADVDVNQVHRVEWELSTTSADLPVFRDFMILTHWEAPYGVREYRGVLREDPPYPYLLATGIRNLSKPIQDARIVVAWLNEENQVVTIATAELSSGTVQPIGTNEYVDFDRIRVSDSEVGPTLFEAIPMYWVVGE